MVDVFSAELASGRRTASILKHFAITPVAAAHRIDSMFASQQLCSTMADFTVNVHDRDGRILRQKNLDQHVGEFSDHARRFRITRYSLEAKRPLRLMDLWEDDPIGSAGPKVVAPEQLTRSETAQINALFKPFNDIAYPPQIHDEYSLTQIRAIKRSYANNKPFLSELHKRKLRSQAINEDYAVAQYHEIVWLDLTFKLKRWAIGRGFDCFVYANHKEGHGQDTFVNLVANQYTNTGESYAFRDVDYRAEMPELMKTMFINPKNRNVVIRGDGYWGQTDPMRYWEPVAIGC